MKVLWLSHLVPYPPKSGVELRSYNLLRELSRHHTVRMIGLNQPALVQASDLPESIRALEAFCEVGMVLPNPTSRTPSAELLLAARSLFTRLPYTVNWGFDLELDREFAAELRRFRPDIVHFDTLAMAPYAQHCSGVPCTLTHHNIESDMLDRRAGHEKNPLKRLYFHQEAMRVRAYERAVASRFAAHLVCSTLDAERLVASCAGVRAEVVPNGVDVQYFDPSLVPVPRRTRTIVFAGGLRWYPNLSAVQFLVEQVWPIVRERDDQVRLIIIGSGAPDWLVKKGNDDDRLDVTGFVDDVRPYLASAGAYACPIFDGGGTKLKVLDALAMGVPLVANPIACEGIDVVEGEHVLYASTPADFASRLLGLLDDPVLQARLSAAGRRLMEERYAFRSIGDRLAALYEELCAANRP